MSPHDDLPILLAIKDGISASGFMLIENSPEIVEIRVRSENEMSSPQFLCPWHISKKISKLQPTILNTIKASSNLSEAWTEVKHILSQTRNTREKQTELMISARYSQLLLTELDELGWNNVVDLDAGLSRIVLRCGRDDSTTHLTAQIPAQYPDTAPVFSTELPVPFDYKSSTEARARGHLSAAVSQLEELCMQLCRYRELASEVAESVCFVQPAASDAHLHTTWRLRIDDRCYVELEMNPLEPEAAPAVSLLGPQHAVAPMLSCLRSRLGEWSASAGLLENLRRCLGTELQSRDQQTDVETVTCGVCYSETLEGCLPSVSCDEPNCAQMYHRDCIVQWFKGLPDCRQSFNVLFSDCPYCGKTMKVELYSNK